MMSAAENKAVFLSYARDDAAAARRIAEALRSSGLEVWFDENELRGGDAWDTKIRRQINDCTLFLAIISRNTESRAKGYFRLEWKLAVEQTHMLLEGVPYVVPVAIDDTPESAAAVPPEFLRVQWMRLPGALPTPQFVGQVLRLLDAPRRPSRPVVAAAAEPGPGSTSPATSTQAHRSAWRVTFLAAIAVLAISTAEFLWLRHPAAESGRNLRPDAAATVTSSASAPLSPSHSPSASNPAAPDAKSVAVLPFANLSTEKENEFFADGVQDDVITNLSKIRDLTVISRTSTLAYRDPASRNLKKIAADLGVATILEGSVRRVGGKVHMNAQLIDARTDTHLWADTFDGDTSDPFALQASLAQKIAAALKATLTPGERTLIERRPTHNAEAYDLYVRARLLHQETGEEQSRPALERVLNAYQQVIAKDPEFALAHAQTALVHLVLYWFGSLDPSPERAAMAKAEIDTARRLAPDAPETHLALGAYYYRVLRDWNGALAEFRTAEPGLPNDAQLFFWLAVTHRRLGRWTEAIGYFERSAALGPHDLATVFNYTQSLRSARRWVQTVEATTRCLEFFPAERGLTSDRIRAQFMLDGNREAFLRAVASLSPTPNDPAGLVDAYLVALWRGDWAAADRALADARLTAIPSLGTVIPEPPALHRAGVAFLRGDHDAARQFAAQAIAALRAGRWNERQQPWVRMGIARAEALAGRSAEALRDAEAAIAETRARDATDFTNMRTQLVRIYLVLDQRDAAFGCLREMMADYCDVTPNEIRLDPFWSRLKDDPRFEEILKTAKVF